MNRILKCILGSVHCESPGNRNFHMALMGMLTTLSPLSITVLRTQRLTLLPLETYENSQIQTLYCLLVARNSKDDSL